MKLEKCIKKPSKRVNVVNVKVNIGRIPYLTMNIGSVSLSANVGTYVQIMYMYSCIRDTVF
jgi:hypothetical protein